LRPLSSGAVAPSMQVCRAASGAKFESHYEFLDLKSDVFYEGIVTKVHEWNFTSQGRATSCGGMFEVHLRLLGRNRVSEGQRAYLHRLTASCSRVAGWRNS
jgi:hypothetical protein